MGVHWQHKRKLLKHWKQQQIVSDIFKIVHAEMLRKIRRFIRRVISVKQLKTGILCWFLTKALVYLPPSHTNALTEVTISITYWEIDDLLLC